MLSTAAFLIFNIVGVPQSVARQVPKQEALLPTSASSLASSLPSPPAGKSTVIGGEIRNVDPVCDQFTVKVFGGQSIRVLFDERTQVYRDGKRIPLLALEPDDHASVETTLDGAKIFALRIHLLSQLPEGEWQGQVLSYKPQIGELVINVGSSQKPVTLRVPVGTPVVRTGQAGISGQTGKPAELDRGSVVEVKFRSRPGSQGVATRIDVLAERGSTFVFTGKLSFLDLHSGQFMVIDRRDNQPHEIGFDPSRFPVSGQLNQGMAVRVTTTFDGTRYVASEITVQ